VTQEANMSHSDYEKTSSASSELHKATAPA
jgi:hypothetical protein